MQPRRPTSRPRSFIPDPEAPPIQTQWFHAIDCPILPDVVDNTTQQDPSALSKPNVSVSAARSKHKRPTKWIPFSKRDSEALEKAFQAQDGSAKVAVNEDHLFEVNVIERSIRPVYWQGPTFEVRRATWFMLGDGSKWMPCEEVLAEQMEHGYYKHKPYQHHPLAETMESSENPAVSTTNLSSADESTLDLPLAKHALDKPWNLLGPYLGQYAIYTGSHTARLLSHSASSKLAKSIIKRLTNKQNVGGTRLVRGYTHLKELQQQKSKMAKPTTTASPSTTSPAADTAHEKGPEEDTLAPFVSDEEDANKGEEDVRKIDHLVFVIHGVGQKMTERTGQSFVQDVDLLRKSVKRVFPAVMETGTLSQRTNGIQVLPVLWRQDIQFGMACEDEGIEADLGMFGVEDGCPTLDELTLEGVPHIRSVISDVLMDVPLYMTPKYRSQMTRVIIREMNRVYRLFVKRNPDFLQRHGKVSILGHSLGSLLAFDTLMGRPWEDDLSRSGGWEPSTQLPFPVNTFFALGSPLGVILLLRGYKLGSRKAVVDPDAPASQGPVCRPAVDYLYNIFHQMDPVAYRLEPLIARQYSAHLTPEPVPHVDVRADRVRLAADLGIAYRAGAMYESIKMGITANLFMRGLGLSRQHMTDDGRPPEPSPSSSRGRSQSDPYASHRYPATSAQILGARQLQLLNHTGRVDYCVQDTSLDPHLIQALNTHLQYWQNLDVAALIVRALYPLSLR